MGRPQYGESRFCSNERCRKLYPVALNANKRINGLCQECTEHVNEGRGWALNMDLYIECQKAAAAEPKFHNGGARRAKAEREALERLDAIPPRLSPLAIEGMLDGGYKRQVQTSGANGWPSHLTGKKGGPRGSSD